MLRQNYTQEGENNANSENGEEVRENRLRNPKSPVPEMSSEMLAQETGQLTRSTTLAERISPKTSHTPLHTGEETQHIHQRVKSTHKPVSGSTRRVTQKNWFAENVTNNPMYHKEMLAGRRVLELKTPIQRLLTISTPFVVLGCIYYSIYYAISYFYDEAYSRNLSELIATNPMVNGKVVILNPDVYAQQMAHASQQAWVQAGVASMVSYCILLGLQFLVAGIGIPLMTALKITSEREKMNWNSLIMSRLTPQQILLGKSSPILRTILLVHLVSLPALIITAIMSLPALNATNSTSFSVAPFMLRALFLPQLIILATAVLNTAISLYFSLTQKKSIHANAGAARWTMMTIVGPAGLTGLFYAIPNLLYMMRHQGQTPPWPDWIHPLLALPNVFNPIAALISSLVPNTIFINNYGGYYNPTSVIWAFLVGIVPFIYLAFATRTTHRLWKKMLEVFENAPKDASG